MAPKGFKNKELLEGLADIFEGKFWDFPGLFRVYAFEGTMWRVRTDLGYEFKNWLAKDVQMTANGVSLELDLASDTHKAKEWTDNFNAKVLRRKYCMIHYKQIIDIYKLLQFII